MGAVVDLRERARKLRQTLTSQEVKLWSKLKFLNRGGYHFRRQAPVDGYVLDFAEFSHRLIIEVDGSQHGFDIGQRQDAIRDAHFRGAGFRILRFWNRDVYTNMDGVIDTIVEALKHGPHPALRATLPAEGEGE